MERSGQFHTAHTTSATPAASTASVTISSPHCSGKTAGRRGAMDLERKRRHMGWSVAHTGSVQEAFGIVLFVVVGVSIAAALYAAAGSGALYRQIGRGGLMLDRDDDHVRPTAPAVSRAVADEEIRQMLAARNTRRAARGEAPLDVEDELARLTSAPAAFDPQLEGEVRSLVVARNARLVRQGKEPLDVESEVRRQLDELGGAG